MRRRPTRSSRSRPADATESTVSAATSSDAAAATDPAGSTPTSEALPDLDVVDDATSAELSSAEQSSGGACTMTVLSLRHGEAGESVSCLQGALAAAGYFTGTVSGQFDQATYDAVKKVQEERNLYVDGVVGRETALSLEIWPEEESLVTRTPAPAPGAVDAWGYPLSSVASTGDGAPPVPANSGSGRRVVYERAGQRVWAIDKDENIIRSWLVSGSQYSNEVPGTHQVYSKSEVSTAWNGKAFLPLMVRWYQTDIGHLGFHAIPMHRVGQLAVPDRGRARHPPVRRLPAPGQSATPSSCGTSPTSAPPSSSCNHADRPSRPPRARAQSNSCIRRADGARMRTELLYRRAVSVHEFELFVFVAPMVGR